MQDKEKAIAFIYEQIEACRGDLGEIEEGRLPPDNVAMTMARLQAAQAEATIIQAEAQEKAIESKRRSENLKAAAIESVVEHRDEAKELLDKAGHNLRKDASVAQAQATIAIGHALLAILELMI